MYHSTQLARKYLQYYISALNGKGHGMHSPFVFDFILRVMNNGNNYRSPAAIEELRASLLKDERMLRIEDHGAGSRVNASRQRSVSGLAKSAVKPKKYGQLLYRLARHYNPQTILELGTSLGITTAYLASANPYAQVVTIEGSGEIAAVALQNFDKIGLNNILLHAGTFDNVLPQVLEELKQVDLAYIDGNHRYEPTINYFHQLLPICSNNSILVFDDIHWSREMEQAWRDIRQHPSVRCSLDLFFLGFVFFRREFHEKQHFAIRF